MLYNWLYELYLCEWVGYWRKWPVGEEDGDIDIEGLCQWEKEGERDGEKEGDGEGDLELECCGCNCDCDCDCGDRNVDSGWLYCDIYLIS